MLGKFPNLVRLEVGEGEPNTTEGGTVHRRAIIDRFRTAHPKLVQVTVRSDGRQVTEWVSSQ